MNKERWLGKSAVKGKVAGKSDGKARKLRRNRKGGSRKRMGKGRKLVKFSKSYKQTQSILLRLWIYETAEILCTMVSFILNANAR